ncbi:MAG: hypothetical protein K5894_16145 [Lachnospiraceae bacterium]|nr:hypothetical protein [Lachnospiraceae bacterium]
MKKIKKAALCAGTGLAGLILSSCGFNQSPPSVYGPPTDFEENADTNIENSGGTDNDPELTEAEDASAENKGQ